MNKITHNLKQFYQLMTLSSGMLILQVPKELSMLDKTFAYDSASIMAILYNHPKSSSLVICPSMSIYIRMALFAFLFFMIVH